jgi:hypothetical protein
LWDFQSLLHSDCIYYTRLFCHGSPSPSLSFPQHWPLKGTDLWIFLQSWHSSGSRHHPYCPPFFHTLFLLPVLFLFYLFFISNFETGSHYVVQGEIAIFLPQPHKCWDYSCVPPYLNPSYLLKYAGVKAVCHHVWKLLIFLYLFPFLMDYRIIFLFKSQPVFYQVWELQYVLKCFCVLVYFFSIENKIKSHNKTYSGSKKKVTAH